MPEDIFDNLGEGTEIHISKPKKIVKRKQVRPRATVKRAPKKTSIASHAAQVDAALHAIAREDNGALGMEVGGHVSAFNPTPRFYRTIALSFLAGAIVLIAAVIGMTTGKAVITIKTKPQTITFDAPVSIALNAAGGGINGVVRSVQVSGSRSFSPETGPEEPSYAFGSVIITNNSKENQPLIATTRFLAKNDVLFRLRRSTVVPAGGKVNVEIIADKPGKGSEIGPSQFRIPGLSEAKQKLIFAESSSSMTGGTSRKSSLTEPDVERASSALTAELFEQGKKQLMDVAAASSTVQLSGVFVSTILEAKNDSKLGAVTSQFTLAMKIRVIGVLYTVSDLNAYILQAIQSNTAYADSTISPAGTIDAAINRTDEKAQTAELRIKQEWMVKAREFAQLIEKKQLTGLTAEDTARALKGLDWVDEVRVVFSPGWVKKVPKNADKIQIKFVD